MNGSLHLRHAATAVWLRGGVGRLVLAGLLTAMSTTPAAVRAAPPDATTEAVAADVPAAPVPDAWPALAALMPKSPAFWSTTAAFSAGRYRWSASRGAFDFGIRFKTPARAVSPVGSRLESPGAPVESLPALSFGLRRVDQPASSWLRRAAGTEPAPGYSRWVGIEWKPAEAQVMFIRQGLGVRLGSDERLSMRLKRGSLGLYYKREF